jgi:hypothetical protein
MEEEVGRWFTWFLEDRGEARYRRHLEAVAKEARHLAWRALIAVVVDKRLYPEADKHRTLFRPMTTSYPRSEPQPWWQHYAEVSGRGQWLVHRDGEDYLTLACEDKPVVLSIPLKAIVSYRSTGFPKVAYNVEQFLIGYLTPLVLFADTTLSKKARQNKVGDLESTMLEENYPLPILELLKNYANQWRLGMTIHADLVHHLQTMMIKDMETQIERQCKGMYHHAIEWHVDPMILKNVHPLVKAYRRIREARPNLVPGRAFISVKTIKKSN